MAGISTLTSTMQIQITWSAGLNITGSDYAQLTQGGSITKKNSVGTGAANAAVGGGDEFVSFIQTIAASGNATVDLTSVTDILQRAAVSIARLKGYIIRLLSVSDDSVNGTACSSITVGIGATPCLLEMSSATPTFNINNGGAHCHFDPSAAGFVVITTNKNIRLVNNDGSNAAAVQLTFQCAQS